MTFHVSMGAIMACAATKKRNAGESRLFRILISESAHLIWRLRCERVINEQPPFSDREVKNRWLKTINMRLRLDRLLTNKNKYGRRAFDPNSVKTTWCKVLKDEANLPKDWHIVKNGENGVLVGVG